MNSPQSPLKGNINHAVAWWCFALDRATALNTRSDEPCPLTTQTLATAVKAMGVNALELAPQTDYPLLANMGMTNAMGFVNPYASQNIPPFVRGWNNPKYRTVVTDATVAEIDLTAQYEWPSVIAFVGYDTDPTDGGNPISRKDAFRSCVAGLKKVAKHAEAKKVTVCLEHLNTRDGSHPMFGHPGYQGDNLDFVARIVQAVGSPFVKILFDVYHVQVMHGDIIRRLRSLLEQGLVGHIHTAGNPGRCEIGPGQEICYPSVVKTLVAGGYKGYVGHEHVPVWDDKIKSIQNSVTICDA